MSKRFGNFQLKQPSTAYKKARLDIEVTPSQQYSQQLRQQQEQDHFQVPTSSIRTPTTVAKSSSKTDDYLWGDEDDEFIILASQAVEEVELFQGSQSGEVTFGRFAKQSSITSSTQHHPVNSAELMPPPPPAASAIPGPSRRNAADAVPTEIIDLLGDDDDDVFGEQLADNYADNVEKHIEDFFKHEFDDDFNLNEFQQNGCRGEEKEEQVVEQQKQNGWASPPKKPRNGEVVFKPKQPVASAATAVSSEASPRGRILASQQQQNQAAQEALRKKDHAKDIQLKFLTGQLELASKKTEKLQKDYNEVLERMQTRDGEVSILRYELKSVKGQNDQLRLDKMKESETMQKEWVEKMKDLEKVIVAQKAELDFKSMEMISLRSKRLNSSFKAGEKSGSEKPVTEADFKIHSRQMCLHQGSPQPTYEIDPKIFELSAESISKFNIGNRLSGFSKSDAILSQHLGFVQTCLSQMVCLRRPPAEESVLGIEQTANQALEGIEKYCNRLQLVRVKDAHLGPKVAYDFLCKNSSKDRLEGDVNIFQREPISGNEQGVIPRRFLAALGLLVRYVPSLAVSLVQQQDGRENCTEQLGKILKRISYAKDLYDHLGMITAASLVLCGLTHHVQKFGEHSSQVMNLFKSIVRCRPDSAYTLSYLSEALCRISSSERTIDLLDQLCWRSLPSSFAVNETYKMVQFTKDSCTLQIYAVLLETSVPQNRQLLSPLEMRHLVTNTRHTIRLLRNAVTRPVRWIREFYEASRHRSSSRPVACQCHIRLTNAFVVLLHQVLRCWSKCPLSVDINAMLQIAQQGVLLLYDLFQTAYRPAILHIGGHPIQCRLQACYNWLVQHQNDFRFQSTHKTALRLLDLRLVMDEPLKSSDDEDHKLDAEGLSNQDSLERERRLKHDDLFEDFFTSKLLL